MTSDKLAELVEACHQSAEKSLRPSEKLNLEGDRFTLHLHASVIASALFEIAYQLAVQNERSEKNQELVKDLKEKLESKWDQVFPDRTNPRVPEFWTTPEPTPEPEKGPQ